MVLILDTVEHTILSTVSTVPDSPLTPVLTLPRVVNSLERSDTNSALNEFKITTQLRSYLAFPLKRMFDYKYYIEKVAETTPTRHPDHIPLQKVAEEISGHVSGIEKIILKGKREAVVLSWQNMFSPPISLEASGRHLIRHGKLVKAQAGVTGRQNHAYYFWLFNDILVYATHVKSGQYQLRRMLPFQSSTQITDIPDEKGSKKPKCAIQLDLKEPEKTLILLCNDAADKEGWLHEFREARKQLLAREAGSIGPEPSLILMT